VSSEQLLKGVLDILVLAVLARAEAYGYDITQQLREAGLADLGEASVYGTLRRLQQQGWLTSRLVASSQGPARRYYQLTRHGKQALEDMLDGWEEITDAVDTIVRPRRGRR